ncbi:MAG: hypothetical protein Q9164_000273 [Protoblastenia rupestris]
MAQLPILPHGSPSLLSALAETFSFHSSPESFITSRVLAFRTSHPSLAESRTPIRAKVLNRNVAVISSYDQVKQLLCDEIIAANLSACKAYDELMAPFFPPPNLLLSDPPTHRSMKEIWSEKMAPLTQSIRSFAQTITLDHFRSVHSGSSIDLYENMKALSWNLILGIFLSDSANAGQAVNFGREVESLQEDLLRGQFSLFPISISTRLWQSPRSKGLAARQKLQTLLRHRVENEPQGCPFASSADKERDDVASHTLLFTSSLAVKALASLLTAVMLNVFVYRAGGDKESDTLASKMVALMEEEHQEELLRSVILETERLSPSVVGIMRRTTADVVLSSGHADMKDTLIPKDWDAWLYIVGAARDPAVFGDTADEFYAERYYAKERDPPMGLAFGTGPKGCLGEHLVREIIMAVVKTCLCVDTEASKAPKTTVNCVCNTVDIPVGVQGWLGWRKGVKPEDWARDVKQLPTQRPIKPVMVTVEHSL